MKNDITVVVSSCDNYSDLWDPFFNLFFRYWADCPWPIVLMSNEKKFDHPLVKSVAVGHLGSWSSEMKALLGNITTSHVLVMLDDFFLRNQVNCAQIEQCFREACGRKATMFRLVRRPGPDAVIPEVKWYGAVSRNAPYRISTQCAIWTTKGLDGLLRAGESIWEFEACGARASDDATFYGVYRDVLPYKHHVVERGKWFRQEARRFGGMDIGCDFSRRAVMTRAEMMRWRVRKVLSVIYDAIPWRWRRGLGDIAIKLGLKQERRIA